ncbi:MAG: diguanylate cyclase [Kangiellaceae bacterium]|nr:diguanylate cyclase [Kangiellaceae bacterium]
MRRFKQQVALTILFFITSLHVQVLALSEGQVDFTIQERQFLNSLTQIKLCTARESLPLDDIQDDKHIGINADYMELFEKQIGIPITLLPTKSWDESLLSIKTGRCDIIALATRTPQREKYLLFSDSYVNIPFVVVTTQEKFFVSKMEDMISRDLGVNRGYAYNDLVRNRWPEVNLVEVETINEGLDLVASGEIFGYMTGLNMAGYAIQTGGYTNLKINGQFDELETIELGIGIRKQLPLLQPILNKAIASVNPETKKRIDSSWLTVRYDIVEDYQTIIQIAVGAGVILLFLAYRQFHLRQHNIQLAEREKAIWHQANYDFLTGLPNRRLFQDRLSHKIDRVIRTHKSFALLLIDLDGFKEVNDTLGHDQGDQMLIEASNRIQNCLRKSDTIARLGGDEFVVILNDIENRGSVETVAQKILDTLMRPFKLKDTAFISASIGITLCPKDSLEMVELLKNADQAMYAAKENGRNKFNYFTPEMQQSAMTRMLLVKELRQAIQEEQFEVFYQPIIDFKQKSNT